MGHIKLKFKLGTVTLDVNAFYVTDKETENKMKRKSMEEIKISEIDVRFEQNLRQLCRN